MPEIQPNHRSEAYLDTVDARLVERGLPVRAQRRETVGKVGLAAADILAVGASTSIVAGLTGARLTPSILALLALFPILAKSARLYDRDQFVLHKTTLDEAPA